MDENKAIAYDFFMNYAEKKSTNLTDSSTLRRIFK
jgi:hypothetical protein